jgi:hypothetical protein
MITQCVEVPRQQYDVGRNAFDCSTQLKNPFGVEVQSAIGDIKPLHRSQPKYRGYVFHLVPSGSHQFSLILWRILPRAAFEPATSLTVENGYDMQFGQSTVTQQKTPRSDRLVVGMRSDNKDPLSYGALKHPRPPCGAKGTGSGAQLSIYETEELRLDSAKKPRVR